jgi:hypothetical protein
MPDPRSLLIGSLPLLGRNMPSAGGRRLDRLARQMGRDETNVRLSHLSSMTSVNTLGDVQDRDGGLLLLATGPNRRAHAPAEATAACD